MFYQDMQVIAKYFKGLTERQMDLFAKLEDLYLQWNQRVNLVSRKDIDNLYIRHVLHSLAIGKLFPFRPGANVLDAGTGGGFPGIPLAILFPDTHFLLVDATLKKIKAVTAIKQALGLQNIIATHSRIEALSGQYDFITARALMPVPSLYKISQHLISREHNHPFRNGYLLLKGGDLKAELTVFHNKVKIYDITEIFGEEFFKQKKIVYLSI